MTVALSQDFLWAFSNVQKGHQKKVREFIEKFQAHPESGGLHYEPIQSARDKNFYSVRIDQAYRAVIARPSSELFVLMWVDHHDDAYNWAAKKKLEVHPATGALQIIEVGATEAPADTVSVAASQPGPAAGRMFAGVKDKHLLNMGVPPDLLPVVRSMNSDSDLEKAEHLFPQEAYEALYLLASGYTVEEVFADLNKPAEGKPAVDTGDFAAALTNEDSLRRFHVVEGGPELAEILTAPLELWRIFLHPKQRQLVRMRSNGPVRVLGGAGTGKTVVAMHRARYLAEEVFTAKTDRILLTTFTKNLAIDIQHNLRKLCSEDSAWGRIEVVHLDGWVSGFLRSQGFRHKIVYGEEGNEAWQNALNIVPASIGLPNSFYRAEWESVIQAQNITSADAYLQASRLGRGTRLSREAKKQVWKVFEEYRAQLNQRDEKEYVDLIRDARQWIETKAMKLPYRSVIVDEAQDMSAEAVRLLRVLVPAGPDDLFIVGDAHQRIYSHRVSLGKCGIDIRGRGRKLRINYRTTDEIRKFAVRLLEGRPIDDLDAGQDDQKGYMSLTHGAPPDVSIFAASAEEAAFLRKKIESLVADGTSPSSICLVARTKKLCEVYAAMLEAAGTQAYTIKRDSAEQREKPGVRVATMHRIKGLEFDHILAVAVNKGIVPLEYALDSADDAVAQRNIETGERALLYVALTRAKKSASITAYGDASPYIR